MEASLALVEAKVLRSIPSLALFIAWPDVDIDYGSQTDRQKEASGPQVFLFYFFVLFVCYW